jgi:hypothetical protein
MALSEPSKSCKVVVEVSILLSGDVTKGDYVLLEGFPCKIVAARFSKTGKHGHLKAHLTGIDIMTGKKYTWAGPGDASLKRFKPDRREYILVDAEEPLKSDDSSTKSNARAEVSYLDEDNGMQSITVDRKLASRLAKILRGAAEDVTVKLKVVRAPCQNFDGAHKSQEDPATIEAVEAVLVTATDSVTNSTTTSNLSQLDD